MNLIKTVGIKIIGFDIDGTLTDGSIYIGERGEALKVFNVRDGYGIKAAQKAGFEIFFITGRKASEATKQRIHDLKIDLSFLKDDVTDKVTCAEEILKERNLTFNNFAFMGDDLPDLPLLKRSGYSGCPADAHSQILKTVSFISVYSGGKGAAREFIETILLMNGN